MPEHKGSQRIDYSEAEQMLRSGKTQKEVAEHFGVSAAAVSAAIRRGNIKHHSGYQRLLPWKMKAEHAGLAIPRALRLAERIRLGQADGMPDYLRVQGEGFIARLRELDAVIHYDPSVAPYWFRVPRRHGVDFGYVREPDVPDEDARSEEHHRAS